MIDCGMRNLPTFRRRTGTAAPMPVSSDLALGLQLPIERLLLQPGLARIAGQEWLLLGEDQVLPTLALTPTEAGLDRGAGRRRCFEHAERHLQHGALLPGVPRLAARSAERKVDEQQSRHGGG